MQESSEIEKRIYPNGQIKNVAIFTKAGKKIGIWIRIL